MGRVGTTNVYALVRTLSNGTAFTWHFEADHDYRYAWGSGFHNYLHGRAIFPDSLRWLWRDHPRESRPESLHARDLRSITFCALAGLPRSYNADR